HKHLLIAILLPLPLLMARGGGGGGGEAAHGYAHGAAESHPAEAARETRNAIDARDNRNYGDYGYSDPYYAPIPPPTTQQAFPQSPESDNYFNDPNWPNVQPGSTYNNNPPQ
ncbi:MAG: hypothetical protein ACK4HV_08595, partial [Parachlamydiaceae bacterium]